MVSPVLWDVRHQERKECVDVSRSGSNVAGVSSGGGNSFFTDCTGGVLKRYKQGGAENYGTDAAVGSLRYMVKGQDVVPSFNATSEDAKSGIGRRSRDKLIKCVEFRPPFMLPTCRILHDTTPAPPKTRRSAFGW